MQNNHSVAACYVRDLLAGAISKGFNVQPLLLRLGISNAQINNDQWRTNVDSYAQLMQGIWQLTHDESAGYAEQPLKPGSFAMMCQVAIGAPNLHKAFARAIRFFSFISEDLQLSLTENDSQASFVIAHTSQRGLNNLFYVEMLSLIFIRWASWIIDKKLLVSRIDFTHATPNHALECADIFGCAPHFNQAQNKITFATRFLRDRVAQNEQSLIEFLAQAPISLLSHYRRDTSMSWQIRQLLHHAARGQEGDLEPMGLEQIAEHLHLTSQTLRRRLKEEGNSFQEIKDAVRSNLAIHCLVHEDLPMQTIAERMGYSETSVFYKAFKRWTGLTPGAFREQHLNKKTR